MIVKIGKLIFDSDEEPILISFTPDENILLSKSNSRHHICCYSEKLNTKEVKDWMETKTY